MILGLANQCPNIEQFHLEQCSLTGQCIPHIAIGLRRLMKLTLKSCRIIHSHRPVLLLDNQSIATDFSNLIGTERFLRGKSIHCPISLDFTHTIGIGDYILPFTLQFYSSRIDRLNVSFCHLQNFHFNLICDFCSFVTALLIPGCSITDDQLIPLVSRCWKLETLILGLCPNLTERSILTIAKYLKCLKTFALWGNFHALNDENAEAFSRGCCNLEKATFTLTGISDTVIKKLFQNCRISKIEINRCQRLTDDCMLEVVQHTTSTLTHFIAENVYFTDIACISLSKCHMLELVNLSHSKFITSFGICSILKSCPRLGTLKIKNCSNCKLDDVIDVMRKFQAIRVREFDASENFCKAIENLVSLVEQCTSLSKLVLVNCLFHIQDDHIAKLVTIANDKKIVLCV